MPLFLNQGSGCMASHGSLIYRFYLCDFITHYTFYMYVYALGTYLYVLCAYIYTHLCDNMYITWNPIYFVVKPTYLLCINYICNTARHINFSFGLCLEDIATGKMTVVTMIHFMVFMNRFWYVICTSHMCFVCKTQLSSCLYEWCISL